MVSKTERHCKYHRGFIQNIQLYMNFNILVANGEIFDGVIASVINSHNFYAVIQEELQELVLAIDSCTFEEMFWIPGLNEPFMVRFDEEEEMLRAKRIEGTNKGKLRYYLLDTGETFEHSVSSMLEGNMYVMPPKLHEIPPLAFRCFLNWLVGEVFDSNFLKEARYESYTMEVMGKRSNGSYRVEMWKTKESSIVKTESPKEIHPFDDEEVELLKDESNTEDISIEENAVAMIDVEEHMRQILSKEEPIIYDAQVAVHGFRTKDDEHRCKFYDPRTGGCWKKGRCTERHIAEPEDEAFRDKATAYHYDVSEPLLPKRCTYYRINIISFNEFNIFTCHYSEEHKNIYNGKSLKTLREKLNSGSYSNMKTLPAVGELVTVKINDKFYRARVLEEMDEFMAFPVYLVDEGTYHEGILYENIFEYCVNLKEYPFFAIEMKIDNIEPLDEENPRIKEAHNWIMAIQQNAGPLEVLIV